MRFVHPPLPGIDEQRSARAIGEVGVEGAFDGSRQRLERQPFREIRSTRLAELVA
jgi:hypothetical protein